VGYQSCRESAPITVDGNIVHQIKFAVAGPFCTPLAQVFAIFAVVSHARISVAIGDKTITLWPEVESRRAIERVLRVVIGSGRARAEVRVSFMAARRPAAGQCGWPGRFGVISREMILPIFRCLLTGGEQAS
jgi:hypothetical protein